MPPLQKACPVVTRHQNGQLYLLAFRHPSAGNQLVKGSVKPNEQPSRASLRELFEESGVTACSPRALGAFPVGSPPIIWHFFHCQTEPLPTEWSHQTLDDHGHQFDFFWHRLTNDLSPDWHPSYRRAIGFITKALLQQDYIAAANRAP